MPRVSVLIPLYNSRDYIREAIESVLGQTYHDYEIIVADDGSTDGSGDIVRSFENVIFYDCEHKGISATRNYLISKAGGELITFIDADDLWDPDKLRKQTEYLDAHPECELVFCRYKNFSHINAEELTDAQMQLIKTEIPYYLPSACIRREVFEKYGFFDPMCEYGEDTELLARIIMGGADVSHKIQEFLYLRRVHTGNITLAHHNAGNKAFYASLAASMRNRLNRGNK